VNLLRLNTIRGTNTALLAPKRYDKPDPCPFYIGVPPPRDELCYSYPDPMEDDQYKGFRVIKHQKHYSRKVYT